MTGKELEAAGSSRGPLSPPQASQLALTSPSLSSLMYVSSFPKPISDCGVKGQIEAGSREGPGKREVGRGEARPEAGDAHQADAAEAAAEGLVEDGAVEGQLLKVALRQPDVGWE